MASPSIQQLANSAGLKVTQYLITGLAFPAAMWFGNSLLARLDKIEAAIAASITAGATSELRLQALERAAQESRDQRRDLNERVIRIEVRLDRIDRGGK